MFNLKKEIVPQNGDKKKNPKKYVQPKKRFLTSNIKFSQPC